MGIRGTREGASCISGGAVRSHAGVDESRKGGWGLKGLDAKKML